MGVATVMVPLVCGLHFEASRLAFQPTPTWIFGAPPLTVLMNVEISSIGQNCFLY